MTMPSNGMETFCFYRSFHTMKVMRLMTKKCTHAVFANHMYTMYVHKIDSMWAQDFSLRILLYCSNTDTEKRASIKNSKQKQISKTHGQTDTPQIFSDWEHGGNLALRPVAGLLHSQKECHLEFLPPGIPRNLIVQSKHFFFNRKQKCRPYLE